MTATSMPSSLTKSSSHAREDILHLQDQHNTSSFHSPMSIIKASLFSDSWNNLGNKDWKLHVPSRVSNHSSMLFPLLNFYYS